MANLTPEVRLWRHQRCASGDTRGAPLATNADLGIVAGAMANLTPEVRLWRQRRILALSLERWLMFKSEKRQFQRS